MSYRVQIILLFIFIFSSCDYIDKFKEHNSNKKESEKIEIKKIYKNGKLASECPYKNGKKHGIVRNYYFQKRSGALANEISYVEGIKEGDSKWYYESGQLYRITPYKNGKKSGIQKKYYENGKIMSEVAYYKNEAQMGLKEYNKSGKLITNYPKIIFKEVDKTAFEDKIELKFYLSDRTKKVEYYKKIVTDNNDTLKIILINSNGVGKVEFPVFPGGYVISKVEVFAKKTTRLRNTYITKGNYNIAYER